MIIFLSAHTMKCDVNWRNVIEVTQKAGNFFNNPTVWMKHLGFYCQQQRAFLYTDIVEEYGPTCMNQMLPVRGQLPIVPILRLLTRDNFNRFF